MCVWTSIFGTVPPIELEVLPDRSAAGIVTVQAYCFLISDFTFWLDRLYGFVNEYLNDRANSAVAQTGGVQRVRRGSAIHRYRWGRAGGRSSRRSVARCTIFRFGHDDWGRDSSSLRASAAFENDPPRPERRTGIPAILGRMVRAWHRYSYRHGCDRMRSGTAHDWSGGRTRIQVRQTPVDHGNATPPPASPGGRAGSGALSERYE